ncbi:MAG: efflux RND transporter permease subunit [Alphaproteobacteria bacterium]
MNISRFFIDRPILASVLSILIFIAGAASMVTLPVAEYPEVVPPSIEVRANYPGANPQVIAETVSIPLEQQVNGVENMLYMATQATSDGAISLTVTFKIGTDIDKAQQEVQNRVNQALPRLPDIVRQVGVTTTKSSSDITMVVHLLSPKERYDMLYLGNYALLNIQNRLQRLPGVGRVWVFGASDYAMRVWLDPDKIASRGMSAADVVNAIRGQNLQVAAGVIGAPPMPEGTTLQLNVSAQGRLTSEEEFRNIILKTGTDGAVTRLKDVARIELGSTLYSLRSLLDNQPAIGIGVFQAPGSNTIAVSNDIRQEMEIIKQDFPEDVEYSIVYDPTTFVRESIRAVVHTLLEAVALVVLVVILFLQTWRASIIPLLAVPVSVVGTFALMKLMGFSINALSLFGLVLSIGIVVDDAIVVVENAQRNIEEGKSPREATYQAMREVSGPIIAIALTLITVFVPIAFISGLTGQFYRQFALTIACSTIISAFNSLTLSPAMTALLLKKHDGRKVIPPASEAPLGWFFGHFNRLFLKAGNSYSGGVRGVLRHKLAAMIVYAGLIALTVFTFMKVPTGYIPQLDKQYLVAFAQLPDGATLDRSEDVVRRMSDIIMKTPGVAHAVAFPGMSINGFTVSSNAGVVFITLKPFEERKHEGMSALEIVGSLMGQFSAIHDAFVLVVPPPPVIGLGSTGGFKVQIEDRGDAGNEALYQAAQSVVGRAWGTKELTQTYSGYQINVPQIRVDIDRTRAMQLGVSISSIFETMQIYLGSLYVNDFNKFGKTYQVIVQADGNFRAKAEDIPKLKVRNMTGEMVPLGSFLTVHQSYGPERAMRYNGMRSADINSTAAPDHSSGEAQAVMEKILKETLPKGMSYEWTDLTYQQILAGNTALYVFPLCVLLVFLVLAAQYESLTLPLAVILIVPMCLLCAIAGVKATGGDNNIFTQIGFMVLVGLACKNAILIVEFARELELEGKTPVEAAIEAARMRLRPILMTSFAFIMGVVPLVWSYGAGAEMRHAMGIAVFSGMLGVTFFGLFLTPVFYVLLRLMTGRKLTSVVAPSLHRHTDDTPPAPEAAD